MNASDTYTLRDHDVAAEDFDGEVVVLDLSDGKYFSLSSGAGAIWNALSAGHSFDTLCAGLDANDANRQAAAAVVEKFLQYRLLKTSVDVAPADLAPIAFEFTDFTVDVYDDLADLLVADPIHEVDEAAGWPHRPPKQG